MEEGGRDFDIFLFWNKIFFGLKTKNVHYEKISNSQTQENHQTWTQIERRDTCSLEHQLEEITEFLIVAPHTSCAVLFLFCFEKCYNYFTMSFAKVFSAQTLLLKPHVIDIEVDLSKGLHSFSVVGLASKEVDEAKDRVGAAIKNSGFTSPKQKNQKVVVALAPADVKKEGPLFDVPIALAYLLACNEIEFDPKGKLFIGELALDGSVRGVHGVLPIVRFAREKGFEIGRAHV